jgi:hypothetical protein
MWAGFGFSGPFPCSTMMSYPFYSHQTFPNIVITSFHFTFMVLFFSKTIGLVVEVSFFGKLCYGFVDTTVENKKNIAANSMNIKLVGVSISLSLTRFLCENLI